MVTEHFRVSVPLNDKQSDVHLLLEIAKINGFHID